MFDIINIKLGRIVCADCGMIFAFDEDHIKLLKKSHGYFYCPRGHQQYFPQKTDEERLRGQLAATKDMLDTARKQRDRYKRSASAQKAAKTKLKNRIKNGICPCCNRYFKNLHQHMQNQHPDFAISKIKHKE